MAAVALTPAALRPYVGGSQTNSILELILGYNGFGRLTGQERGSVGPGGAANGTGQWGPTGWDRLFLPEMGGQVSWLLPAALVALLALLGVTLGAPRTDRRRAAALLWGGWLLVTGLVLSFARGIIHPYYTVALAPAIAALVGAGATSLWRRRDQLPARVALALGVGATAAWSFVLLGRSPAWLPWLRADVLAVGLIAATALLAAPRLPRHLIHVVAIAALAAALAGPVAFSFDTVATAHSGAIPSAGPMLAGGFPGGGRPGGFGPPPSGASAGQGSLGGRLGALSTGQGGAGGAPGGFAGAPSGFGGPPSGTGVAAGSSAGQAGAAPTGMVGRQRGGPGGPGGLGGLLDARTPDAVLVQLLQRDVGAYTWVAATVGANSGAGVELATDDPVMAIGGFNGTDPVPTLAQFQQLVAAGRIHYFLAGGGFAGGPRAGTGSPQGGNPAGGPAGPGAANAAGQIATWVEQHFTASTVGGVTVYDLTQPTQP